MAPGEVLRLDAAPRIAGFALAIENMVECVRSQCGHGDRKRISLDRDGAQKSFTRRSRPAIRAGNSAAWRLPFDRGAAHQTSAERLPSANSRRLLPIAGGFGVPHSCCGQIVSGGYCNRGWCRCGGRPDEFILHTARAGGRLPCTALVPSRSAGPTGAHVRRRGSSDAATNAASPAARDNGCTSVCPDRGAEALRRRLSRNAGCWSHSARQDCGNHRDRPVDNCNRATGGHRLQR